MGKMTKSELRDIIDSIIPTRRDDDGDFVAILQKDEDFSHNVAVYFVLNDDGDKFQMMTHTDLNVQDEERALRFCNTWNTQKSFGQAFFSNGVFRMNFTLNDPAEVPQEYLKSFISLNLAVAWQYYKEIGKAFE